MTTVQTLPGAPGAVLGTSLKTSPSERLRQVLPPLMVLVISISIWWLISATIYADKNYLLPRPMQVVHAALDNPGLLWQGFRITLVEATLGFGLAITVGLLSAIVMSLSKPLERSFYPYAVLLQTVPVIAIAPIIVLWFGYNQRAVIVIAFMIAVFPILNNSLLGLLSTDRNQVDLFRMHRSSKMTEFIKLRLPGALPSIFAGLRISAGLSVVGAIVGEFIIGSGGADGGLGVKVLYAQARLATGLLFAEVLVATLLGFAFFMLVTVIGNRLIRNWHESALRKEN